jgi:hypothetical protein
MRHTRFIAPSPMTRVIEERGWHAGGIDALVQRMACQLSVSRPRRTTQILSFVMMPLANPG